MNQLNMKYSYAKYSLQILLNFKIHVICCSTVDDQEQVVTDQEIETLNRHFQTVKQQLMSKTHGNGVQDWLDEKTGPVNTEEADQ